MEKSKEREAVSQERPTPKAERRRHLGPGASVGARSQQRRGREAEEVLPRWLIRQGALSGGRRRRRAIWRTMKALA